MAAVDRGNNSFRDLLKTALLWRSDSLSYFYFIYFFDEFVLRGSTVRLCSHVMISHAMMYDSTCIGSGRKVSR